MAPERAGERAMPEMSPPLENPPVPMDDAAQARAAIGGSAAVGGSRPGPLPQAPEAEEAAAQAAKPNPGRFAPPQEIEFEFTPPEREQIRNNNVPLTIGLLASIMASFVVFIISMAGNTAGADPLMPSFWRALGALAVLMTLSFTASWFMPAPSNRRQLLDRIDAEEHSLEDRYGSRVRATPPAAPETEVSTEPEAAKGTSIDLTVADEEEDDDTAGFDDEAEDDDEDFEDEDDDEDDEESVAAEASAERANG
jgi:hypothetical protein